MTLIFVLLASSLTALSNLFIRKSNDVVKGALGDPFLMMRLFCSGLMVLTVTFFIHGTLVWDFKMGLLGILAGILLGSLMWTTGRAVHNGPSGLTFAFLNAACVAPPFLMAIFFGELYGHTYHLANGFGAICVVLGLFWMAGGQSKEGINSRWIQWLGCAVCLHVVFLTFFQWRALLLKHELPCTTLLPFHCNPEAADCFSFFLLMTAALFQWILPGETKTNRKAADGHSFRPLLIWGGIGGLINGIASFCMLRATEVADGGEKGLVFPFYCVFLITCCNLWGAFFYHEKINWFACGLCFAGIFIGTL